MAEPIGMVLREQPGPAGFEVLENLPYGPTRIADIYIFFSNLLMVAIPQLGCRIEGLSGQKAKYSNWFLKRAHFFHQIRLKS